MEIEIKRSERDVLQDNGRRRGGSGKFNIHRELSDKAEAAFLRQKFFFLKETPVYVLKASNRLDDPSHAQHQGSSALLRMT